MTGRQGKRAREKTLSYIIPLCQPSFRLFQSVETCGRGPVCGSGRDGARPQHRPCGEGRIGGYVHCTYYTLEFYYARSDGFPDASGAPPFTVAWRNPRSSRGDASGAMVPGPGATSIGPRRDGTAPDQSPGRPLPMGLSPWSASRWRRVPLPVPRLQPPLARSWRWGRPGPARRSGWCAPPPEWHRAARRRCAPSDADRSG